MESSSSPLVKVSPEAARPSTTISQASSEPPGSTSATVRRFSRAPSNTMRLLRQPFQGSPLGDAHRDIDGAMAAALGGPVDLLGRLGGGDGLGPRARPRSPFSGNRRR